MQLQAARTHIKNTEVAVVWVSRYALQNRRAAAACIQALEDFDFGMPVILVAQGQGHEPIVYGNDAEIVRHVRATPLMSLPWETYELQ